MAHRLFLFLAVCLGSVTKSFGFMLFVSRRLPEVLWCEGLRLDLNETLQEGLVSRLVANIVSTFIWDYSKDVISFQLRYMAL